MVPLLKRMRRAALCALLGGLLNMVGEPEREPLRLGGYQAQYMAALSAFTRTMAALHEPSRRASSAAIPKPTIPGPFSVPARRPRYCSTEISLRKYHEPVAPSLKPWTFFVIA